jgi:hypothetical protein
VLTRPAFDHRVRCKRIKSKRKGFGQKVYSSAGMGDSAKNAGRRMA